MIIKTIPSTFIEYLDMVLLMAYSPGISGQKPVLNFESRIKKFA